MKIKLLTLVAGLVLATMASAAPLVINGTLSSSDPTLNTRFYDTYSFTVSQNSFYRLETTAANLSPGNPFDTLLSLYSGSFNPQAPNTNRIAADDDGGVGLLSRIGINLSANTNYIVVVSSFNSLAQGTYTLEIEGREGRATLNNSPVPEPGTYALLLTGALGLAVLKRRRA